LGRAYRTAALSNAYPILRGTAPIVTTVLSFLLFGSIVAVPGFIGILLIVAGILFINQSKFSLAQLSEMLTKDLSYLSLLKRYRWETIAGGLLVFVSNSFAVYAMETTPVTYIAAVREVSIVFAALIGILFLKEKVGLVK